MAKASNKRAQMADELLKKGSATLQKILTASFGEWPPKGLDIPSHVSHDQEVTVQTKDLGEYGGMAMWWKSLIMIDSRLENFGTKQNPFGKYLTNPVLAHEGIHILQAGLRYEITALMSDLIDYDMVHPQKGQLSANFNAVARAHAIDKLSYFRDPRELQARLHEIMADGYQHWKKLPQNEDELWQAFSCFGMKPPAEIARHLEAQPENSTVHDFKTGMTLYTRASMGIQAVHDTLSLPARDKFWYETLPALYADLIEMYGDRPGWKRFSVERPEKPKFAGKIIPPMDNC